MLKVQRRKGHVRSLWGGVVQRAGVTVRGGAGWVSGASASPFRGCDWWVLIF